MEKKISNHNIYITTNDFNKFSGAVFDERLIQTKLATVIDLNNVQQRAIKNEKTKNYEHLI